jgi:hypothetical protein
LRTWEKFQDGAGVFLDVAGCLVLCLLMSAALNQAFQLGVLFRMVFLVDACDLA